MAMQVHAEAEAAAALAVYKRMVGPWPFEDPPEIGPSVPDEDMRLMDADDPELANIPSGAEYRNKMFVNGEWVGMHHYWRDGACDRLVVEDCHFDGALKWASRSYEMRRHNLINRCTIANVVNEHGHYWNISGYNGEHDLADYSVMVKRTLYKNIGSQAWQSVQYGRDERWEGRYREYLDYDSADTPGGALRMRGNLYRNIGFNRSGNARAAFALSFFRSQNVVDIGGVMLDNGMQGTSKGALLIEKRPTAIVKNSVFLTGKLEQPMFKIVGVDRLHLSGLHCFANRDGQSWLQIDNCGFVTVQNCQGNVDIVVDGKRHGNIEQGFTS